MKIASFDHRGAEKIGVVLDDARVVDIAAALGGADGEAPRWTHDMIALIEAGPERLAEIGRAVQDIATRGNGDAILRMEDIVLQPPVRRPSKICCLALNNSANADRIISGPKHPAIFVKASNALIGHDQPIRIKKHFGRVHPEPELALVIGKTAHEIDADSAYDYVFGYTIHNDITSPVMRAEDTFHYRAIHPADDGSDKIRYVDSFVSYSGRYKGTDSFSPMGPWLVTRDEVADPHALSVVCRHEDRVVTQDSTVNLFHKIPSVLAFISSYMTLYPGDIVSMGTALKAAQAGGGAVQNVDLQRLGGQVSVTIEKIGTLTNGVAYR